MTGPTHRKYSVSFAFIAAMILYKTQYVSISYYLTVIILLLTSRHGALFPDLDHTWSKVGNKTVPNKIINTVIHATGGKHRSWQTHSIDICLVFSIISITVPKVMYWQGILSYTNEQVLMLLMIGFSTGWISHLFSDMWTSAGVRLFCFSKKTTIAFVPKKIKIFRKELRFNTGNQWESFCYKIVNNLNLWLGFICVLYPFINDLTIN
jgi:membrane-bound metal-dependent hydrolase YbcI (DUF457 family)